MCRGFGVLDAFGLGFGIWVCGEGVRVWRFGIVGSLWFRGLGLGRKMQGLLVGDPSYTHLNF